LTNSEEKERQRIAAGLHDSVVQSLIAARIKMTMDRESTPPAADAARLAEADEIIGQAIEDVRSLSFELSSPMLHTVGLEQTVEWFAGIFQEAHGIPVHVKSDGSPKHLSEQVRIVLFQSIRELLNNVVRHARANQVSITIKKADKNIEIELKDNGVGFDTSRLFQATSRIEGFGLFNIRERLAFVNGSLALESKIGQGTRVLLKAPLLKD
jgi:signal transduction histidine kinase